MRRPLLILALVLLIPVIAFAATQAVRWRYDEELRSQVEQEFGPIPAESRDLVTLRALCAEPEMVGEEVCSELDQLSLMETGSLLSGGLGAALVGLIAAAGRLARGDRNLLLAVFRPGLYITVAVVIGLVLIDAALAMGTIYFLEVAFLGRIHFVIILGIGAAALFAVARIIRGVLMLAHRATSNVLGIPLDRVHDAPIFEFVDDLTGRLGAEGPEHIVAGLDPTFFVTEADIQTLEGDLRGRTMFVSLPLARILSVDELRAVIGHELGHFRGLDTQFSQRFYPIYRGAIESLVALQSSASSGASAIALLPATALVGFFLESFSEAESEISRARELAADQVGVEVTDRAHLASSLAKLHAFADLWEPVVESAIDRARRNEPLGSLTVPFITAIRHSPAAERLKALEEQRLPHPTDSHPPLKVRLDALGLTMAAIEGAILETDPDDPAIGLVPRAEEIEQRVTSELEQRIAIYGPPPTAPGAEDAPGE
jgi:Zn-dependent protease with chaperone function